jgi:hypothetical protein
MAAGRLKDERSPPPRRRLYTKVFFSLAAGVTLLDLLLLALGFAAAESFRPLGAGVLLIALGSLAWEVVERSQRAGGGAGTAAWIAFPVAILLAFASLPFLALSVYPPAADLLVPREEVVARVDAHEGSLALRIGFPRPMAAAGLNLKLDQHAVPPAYAERTTTDGATPVVRWLDSRTVRIELGFLLAELAIAPPRSLELNALPNAPPFLYHDGEPFPRTLTALEPPGR